MSSYETGETTMRWRETLARRGGTVALLILTSSLLATHPVRAQAQTGPRATGVRSEVSGNTITVFYDLVGATNPTATFTVTLQASLDGGRTFTVQPVSVTGDVGPNVRAGTGKRIVWDATKDSQVLQLNRFSFNVVVAPARPGTSTPARQPAPVENVMPGISTAPRALVGAGFGLIHSDGETFKGVAFDVAVNFMTTSSVALGVAVDVSNYRKSTDFDETHSFLFVGAGARVTATSLGRIAPFGQVVIGRGRTTFECCDFSESSSSNAVLVSGGVDVSLMPRLNLRSEVGVYVVEDETAIKFVIGVSFPVR
jgi:hypothetical protein